MKSKIRISALAIFLVLVVCLTGAHSKNAPAKKGKGDHLKDLELRLERLIEPSSYHYNPSGKPDPFRPFLKSFVKKTEVSRGVKEKGKKKGVSRRDCSHPLECLDVGQLKLVGVVMLAGDGAIAMAQDSAGIGYSIKVGDRIGFNGGRVTSILRDRVIVEEKVEDIEGNLVPRKRVLLLHPEEE